MWGQAISLIAPPACPACGRFAGRHGLAILCQTCRPPLRDRPHCQTCGRFLPVLPALEMHAVTHCRACRLLKPVFHKARSVAPYDGPWREGILALKVHPAGDLLDQMANVFRHVLDSRLPGDWKGIVPVPNRNFRRPHASRELARALAWRTGLPCFEDLAFSRTTRPQRGLKRKARLQNMRNSMVARRTWRGEPLLLVDDVMTTGATANESARALKKAGAGRVGVLTLARGTDPAEPGKKNDARVVNPGNFLYNLASIIPGFHRNIQ